MDPDLARWHANLSRGSSITADVYTRRLGLFCEQNNLNPKELAVLGRDNRKQVEDLIEARAMIGHKHADSLIFIKRIREGRT